MPETMLDRYRLDELLGSGGMGEVWRAHDPVLARDVAVKILRRDVADDEAALERLRVEARLAGSLHHPHVVGVLDYGEEPDHDGAGVRPCLIMPLIEGETVSERLRDSGPMSAADVMRLVADVADGLAAAHAAGIVHRDLKPANIMLDPSGRATILDFGIARSSDTSVLTSTGTILGTADFISPEQASGRPATAASDVYSLGVVAHCCLTGQAPFHHTAAMATALAHLNDPPPPLPGDVPPDAAALVLQMLEKDPQDRPAGAEQVRARAQRLADHAALEESGTVGATESAATAVMPTPATAGTVASETATLPRVTAGRSRRIPVVIAAIVGAVLLAGGVMAATRGGGTEVPAVIGRSLDAATARLHEAGLDVTTTSKDVAGHDRGDVVGQSPDPGTRVDDGETVDLVVASGFVAIPELAGSTADAARTMLTDLGLVVRVTARTTSTVTAGHVVSVSPGDRARIGDAVVLSVAQAPRLVPAPAEEQEESDDDKKDDGDKGDKGGEDKGGKDKGGKSDKGDGGDEPAGQG